MIHIRYPWPFHCPDLITQVRRIRLQGLTVTLRTKTLPRYCYWKHLSLVHDNRHEMQRAGSEERLCSTFSGLWSSTMSELGLVRSIALATVLFHRKPKKRRSIISIHSHEATAWQPHVDTVGVAMMSYVCHLFFEIESNRYGKPNQILPYKNLVKSNNFRQC